MTAPPEMVAAVEELNKKFEAEYIEKAASVGVDGAAILEFFKGEVAKLAAN